RAPPRSRPRLPEPARTTPPGTAVWNSWPFSSGFGDREVERFDGSQRIERLPELLWVPDRHNGERFGMQVLPRDAEHVGLGHRRQRLLILLDEVLGIAEILIGEQAAKRLRARIEGKDEAVKRGFLGGLQLVVGDFGRADLL